MQAKKLFLANALRAFHSASWQPTSLRVVCQQAYELRANRFMICEAVNQPK